MHTPRGLLAVLLSAALPLAPCAWAEEAPAPAPAPEPAPVPAPAPAPAPADEFVEHTAYDIALAEGALPAGWTMVEGDEAQADETALQEAVAALVKAAGVPEDQASGVTRSAKGPQGKAVFLLLDLEQPSPKLAEALGAAAGSKGWTVRTMAHPTRLLVLAAPEGVRTQAAQIQTTWAARMLGMKAWSAWEYSHLDRAALLARAARLLEPQNGPALVVLGIVGGYQALEAKDDKALATAIAGLRTAVAGAAGSKLTPAQAAVAQGELGGLLLQQGGPSPEARDLLIRAVAGAADVDARAALGYRYNLACAHGRLQELDAAFAALGPVLEALAKDPIKGMSHWREDPDFTSLKADPRWAKYLATYGAASSAGD